MAHNFRGDWQMLWKEITIGFLLAGFIAQLGNGFFDDAVHYKRTGAVADDRERADRADDRRGQLRLLGRQRSAGRGAVVGRDLASPACSGFIFADLIVIPIVLIYRKYYGTRFTVRITGLMFVTMVIAALIVDGIFSGLGLIPTGPRPTRADIFSSIAVNYKLALNVLGLAIFAALFGLSARRGATDPVCGMKVDRDKALSSDLEGHLHYFCSANCLHAFEARSRTQNAVRPAEVSPGTSEGRIAGVSGSRRLH